MTWTAFNSTPPTEAKKKFPALQNSFASLIRKSIDLRLQARGPEIWLASSGLLAVNERSVESVGRWPWPRETTAEAIRRAIGAWSQSHRVRRCLFRRERPKRSASFQRSQADKALNPSRIDKWPRLSLSEIQIKRCQCDQEPLREHIVLGSFFEFALRSYDAGQLPKSLSRPGFEQSKAFAIWIKRPLFCRARPF